LNDLVVREVGKRIGIAVATLVAVSALLFVGVSALPGDAATAALGQQGTPARLKALRHQYGLDRPAVQRYVDWLSGFVHGDLGRSPSADLPVWSVIRGNLRNTAILASFVILFLVPLAVGLGVLSALWRDKLVDHVVAGTTLTFISTPEFVVGSILVVIFASALSVLPAASLLDPTQSIFSQWSVLVLPVLTLVLVAVAQATRMIRAAMIEVLQSDYIQAGILRGVSPARLILRHALPNAFDATLQIIAQTIGWLVGGVVVTEILFQYPGIGTAMTNAVSNRDIPTVLGAAMLVTAVYVIANLLADLATIVLNPQMRRSKG
jgi:peptide/nickel transport system permease protein